MSDEEMKSVAASCRHFYWKLFQSTFLISAFTVGGGFVIIPLLRAKYVDEYGWLDDKETLNLVSIAQSMPGVVAVNAAIILGYRMAGLRGRSRRLRRPSCRRLSRCPSSPAPMTGLRPIPMCAMRSRACSAGPRP